MGLLINISFQPWFGWNSFRLGPSKCKVLGCCVLYFCQVFMSFLLLWHKVPLRVKQQAQYRRQRASLSGHSYLLLPEYFLDCLIKMWEKNSFVQRTKYLLLIQPCIATLSDKYIKTQEYLTVSITSYCPTVFQNDGMMYIKKKDWMPFALLAFSGFYLIALLSKWIFVLYVRLFSI